MNFLLGTFTWSIAFFILCICFLRADVHLRAVWLLCWWHWVSINGLLCEFIVQIASVSPITKHLLRSSRALLFSSSQEGSIGALSWTPFYFHCFCFPCSLNLTKEKIFIHSWVEENLVGVWLSIKADKYSDKTECWKLWMVIRFWNLNVNRKKIVATWHIHVIFRWPMIMLNVKDFFYQTPVRSCDCWGS